MRVAIVNDTYGPHAGCQLVSESFRHQLDRVGIELIGTVHKSIQRPHLYPDFLADADLVIVNGEGSIHHGRRQELVDIADRFPAVLVNCVYQDNPPNPALKAFKLVTTRESLSQAELAAHGIDAELVPDVVLTAPTLVNYQPAEPEIGLGVTDNVLEPGDGIPALVGPGHATDYVDALSRHRRLCIGRFHGVLVAAHLGIPFSAWASNTHKTEALMADMGVPHLFAPSRREALDLVPEALPQSVRDYVTGARTKITELFDRLRSLA